MPSSKYARWITAIIVLTASRWAASAPYIPLPPNGPYAGNIQIAAVRPIGQSFIALEPSVGSIWLHLINLNMDFELAQDEWVTLELHAGDSLGGPVLGASAVNVDALIGSLREQGGLVEFNFGNVPVRNGQTYSFEVKAVTTRYGVSVDWLNDGHYDNGHAILQGSASTADLYFGVAAAIPEPAAYQLLLLGLGSAMGLGAIRRRSLPASPN